MIIRKHINVFVICCFIGLSGLSLQSQDIETITEYESAGTFPVSYGYFDDKTGAYVEVERYVTIQKPNTIINVYGKEGIDAEDFIVEKGVFETLAQNEIIEKGKAHAWSTLDGSPREITTVEIKIIDEKLGMYQVIYRTKQGTETVIQVLEQEPPTLLTQETYFNFSEQELFEMSWRKYFFFPIIIFLILLFILFFFSIRKIQETEETLYQNK